MKNKTNTSPLLQIKSMIIFVILTFSSAHLLAVEANLLFKSSFDNTAVTRANINMPILSGRDNTSGFTWPSDLPGDNTAHWFNYVMGDYSNWQQFVESDVVDTTGPDGNPTKALYLEFKKDDPNFVSYTRSQYIMHAKTSGSDIDKLNHLYWKYNIKMHMNGSLDWLVPMEWKVMGETSRVGLYVINPGTPNAYWLLKHEKGTLGGGTIWQETNKIIPVPQDEWYEIEAYWYSTPNSDGFFKIAINGQVLFSKTGANRLDNNAHYVQPFKVYGDKGYSWITDFEIWDKPPSTSILSENYQPGITPPADSSPVTPTGSFVISPGVLK